MRPARDLVLQCEQITGVTIEPLRPEIRGGIGIDQLGVDAHPVFRPPHAAFQNIADAELEPNLLGVDRRVPIGERGIPRNHKHARDARQVGCHILSDAVREISLLAIVAQISKRQHHDR